MFLLEKYIPLFLFSLLVLTAGFIYGWLNGVWPLIYMLTSLIISTLLFGLGPVHTEGQGLSQTVQYSLTGTIKEAQKTQYAAYLILEDVVLEQKEQSRKLRSNVQVYADNKSDYTLNDKVTFKVKYRELESQMNPSDFDYEAYLKAKSVSNSFKEISLVHYEREDTLGEEVVNFLEEKLSKIYTAKWQPIMEAVLFGRDDLIEDEMKTLYNDCGIGHVVCISGFHVGIIVVFMIAVLGFMGISYTPRYLLAILGIWSYAVFTGSSTSAVRAAVMVTILLMGKCLWQEEDFLTSLSAASLLILIKFPYELFQAGFQLSFTAVLGIYAASYIIEKKETAGCRKYEKWQKSFIITLAVQVTINPVLAWHFYEVPLLISLINLLIIPAFSFIIIGGWLSLAISMVNLTLAAAAAKTIESLLSLIEMVLEKMVTWPLATWCTGRPEWWQYSFFIVVVLLSTTCWAGYLKTNYFWKGMIAIVGIWQAANLLLPHPLNITLLYIGQGDSMVIETPRRQMVIIDGGTFGKGRVIENYMKYKGSCTAEAVFVSHSDADHIGGLIELIDSGIKINQAFISKTDRSDLLDQFIEKCQEQNTAVYEMDSGDIFSLDEVKITCLAPDGNIVDANSNNNSMVNLVEYRNFKGLFTGDKEKDSEADIYNEISNISLIKISHHGSRTGTSKELLLKLNPMYAMMSCGRNNLYGHPHGEVLDLLEECSVPYSRTDKNGAVCYETDGYYIKEMKYREDD